MNPAARASACLSPARRALAVMLAMLVCTLGLLAFTPDAHARLHGDHAAHAHDDGGCAITLFAGGVTAPPAAPALDAPPAAVATVEFPAPRELHLAAPRFLHRPLRGPPASE